jgi:hypothetical protein
MVVVGAKETLRRLLTCLAQGQLEEHPERSIL